MQTPKVSLVDIEVDNEVVAQHRVKARELGMTIDQYVVHLIHESRREKREQLTSLQRQQPAD